MNRLLKNETTLKLLEHLCAGEGVEINVSLLSKEFNKHRNTIKNRINQLLDLKIIEEPYYPCLWVFNELPLLVISKDKFYRDEATRIFIENDPHIFAGFYFQEEVYNTLTIQFHANIHSYQTWSDEILEKRKIIKEEDRHPPDASLFSIQRILKFDPVAPFRLIEQGFKRGTIKEIGGLQLDSLNIKILKMVLNGRAIRTNENLLARKLEVNRTTILRHIDILLQDKVISKPVSRFPLIFIPPDYMLILSLFEIKRRCSEVEGFIRRDPRVPLMIKANIGRYNYFVVSTFKTVEDFIDWQERYTQNFQACIEAIKNTYLSPAKIFSIKQNFITLEFLKRKLELLQTEPVPET